MKKYLSYLLALALACGGQATGEYPTDGGVGDAGVDFGQSEQPLTSQVKGTGAGNNFTGVMFESAPFGGLTYGANTSLNNNLLYYIPPFKTFTIKVSNTGCTASQRAFLSTTVNSIIAEWDTSASIGDQWNITRNDSTGTHSIGCANLATSPLGPDSIRNYERTTCTIDSANPVNDGSLSGSAVRYLACQTTIDVPDIETRTVNAVQEGQLMIHATANGLLKLVGVGELDVAAGSYSNSSILPFSNRVMFSSGQLCRTRNYHDAVDSSPTVFGLSTSKNCANN